MAASGIVATTAVQAAADICPQAVIQPQTVVGPPICTQPTPNPSLTAPRFTPAPTDTIKPGVDSTVPAPPPAPTTSAAPIGPVSGTASVSGRIVNGAGAAISGVTVTILPADGGTTIGVDYTPPVLGTAVTDVSGAWTFTLPNPLPAAVQSLADANGGVLNVMAVATGYALSTGQPMLAMDFTSAGTATGAATTPASAQERADYTPDTVTMHPVTAPAGLTPADDTVTVHSFASVAMDSLDTSADYSDGLDWQTADGSSLTGYSSDKVGAVDYSAVQPKDNSCTTRSKTIGHKIRYTTVGESHAYWDAKASFSYNSALSSHVGVEASADGKHWGFSYYESLDSSIGHSTGYDNQGPYFGRQWQVPLDYYEKQITYHCVHGSDSTSYVIEPGGYDVPSGGAVARYGKDVSSKDGPAGYYAAPTQYRGWIPSGTYYTQDSSRSLTYGIAASAFGVGVRAYTNYNSRHIEKITAGNGRYEHDIWGQHGKLSGDPRVVYSF